MTKTNVQVNQKQQDNQKGDEAFEKMLEVVYNDMQSRHTDPEVQQIKDIYSQKLISLPNMATAALSPIAGISKMISSELGKRVKTYPQIHENFRSGGKWDHKVQGKEIFDSYYSKQEKNAEGQPAVIFAGNIPGDNKNVYDHDFWGNISYGYTLRVAGLTEAEIRAAAAADDVINGAKNQNIDVKTDDDAILIGSALYDAFDKKGIKMSKDDFRNIIIANKDKFRRYPIDSLDKRSIRAKDGETLEQIAKREGVSVEDLKKQLEKDAKQNEKLYGNINEQTSLKEGQKINLPRQSERTNQASTTTANDAPTHQVGNVNNADGVEASQSSNAVVEAKSGAEIAEKSALNTNEANAKASQIFKAFQDKDNTVENIMLKPVNELTHDEARLLQKISMFDTNDNNMRQMLDKVAQGFYQYFYDNNPVEYDEMGKMIRPMANKMIPAQTKDLKTKDNLPINDAFKQLANNVADSGVKALQRGLNLLGVEPSLKEDGIIGPKTATQAKKALVNNGLPTIKNTVNIGAFENMVENNRGKEIPQDTLKDTVSKIGNFAQRTLQQGLNALGQKKESYNPLKEDNDIGPKTTSVFNQMKDEEEDGIKSFFKPAKFSFG